MSRNKLSGEGKRPPAPDLPALKTDLQAIKMLITVKKCPQHNLRKALWGG